MSSDGVDNLQIDNVHRITCYLKPNEPDHQVIGFRDYSSSSPVTSARNSSQAEMHKAPGTTEASFIFTQLLFRFRFSFRRFFVSLDRLGLSDWRGLRIHCGPLLIGRQRRSESHRFLTRAEGA
jgi:hypothetical protein